MGLGALPLTCCRLGPACPKGAGRRPRGMLPRVSECSLSFPPGRASCPWGPAWGRCPRPRAPTREPRSSTSGAPCEYRLWPPGAGLGHPQASSRQGQARGWAGSCCPGLSPGDAGSQAWALSLISPPAGSGPGEVQGTASACSHQPWGGWQRGEEVGAGVSRKEPRRWWADCLGQRRRPHRSGGWAPALGLAVWVDAQVPSSQGARQHLL